jgi:hypothetical protein
MGKEEREEIASRIVRDLGYTPEDAHGPTAKTISVTVVDESGNTTTWVAKDTSKLSLAVADAGSILTHESHVDTDHEEYMQTVEALYARRMGQLHDPDEDPTDS